MTYGEGSANLFLICDEESVLWAIPKATFA